LKSKKRKSRCINQWDFFKKNNFQHKRGVSLKIMDEVVDDFISDVNLVEVDKLPPSKPRKERYHKVINAVNKSGNGQILNLNVQKNGAKNVGVYEGLREIAGNLIDQSARSNNVNGDPSFNGLHVSIGQRKNNKNTEDVTVLHNSETKLAEIIHINSVNSKPKQYFAGEKRLPPDEYIESFGTLSFINYGVTIFNANHILAFGGTDKRGLKNQIGQHGEGLKHAIVVLLREGMGVEIYTPVIRDDRPEFQKWRFFLQQGGPTDGNLYYKTTYVSPKRLLKGKNAKYDDTHHFELRITYSKNDYIDYDGNKIKGRPLGLKFDLFNYLAPREYIRSITDDEDPGSLMLNPTYRGHIYGWHFFVCRYSHSNLRWGYDLFIPITRERNMVEHKTLVITVAKIWSRILETCSIEDTRCQQYFDEIVFTNKEECDYVERSAIKYLTRGAYERLTQLFRQRHPDVYPILSENKEFMDRQYTGPTILVPSRAESILFGEHAESFLLFSYVISNNIRLLSEAPSKPVPEIIKTLFPDLLFVNGHNIPLSFAKYNNQIFINMHSFIHDTDAAIIHRIMFEIYPFIVGNAHTTLPIIERFLAMSEKNQNEYNNGGDDQGGDDQGGDDQGGDEVGVVVLDQKRKRASHGPESVHRGFKWVKVEAWIKEKE